MYNVRKVFDDLYYVGADDRRLAMFEGVYSVKKGVSYNSYLLIDEDKTVLFDTVDKAVSEQFMENIEFVLGKRKLDYIVIHHMEPDHSSSLMELLNKYSDVTLIINSKIDTMISQFFNLDKEIKKIIVKENDVFSTKNHEFTFLFAPMVHWPEVMMSYDKKTSSLFSADAFGTFGALNGALFNDELDFFKNYLDEARRYYANIVGKYGPQVQSILKKASMVDIKHILPLHGPVFRNDISKYLDYYIKWSTYTPEVEGVVICYASIYGHTENASNILASKLRELNVKVEMFDVSVTPSSEIIQACFKYSHLIFASSTYNAGIFITMEELLRDLAAHNIQSRVIGLIENGSWAPTSFGLMKKILEPLKNITFIDQKISIKSSLKENQLKELDDFANKITKTMSVTKLDSKVEDIKEINNEAIFKISYGLFILSTKFENKDNACIINTAALVTDSPKRMTVTVNKSNYTHDLIKKSKKVCISILDIKTKFDLIKRFGFSSGKDVDKFHDFKELKRTTDGLIYVSESTNSFIAGDVVSSIDLGTHTLFIIDIKESNKLSDVESLTYQYYFDHIKPKMNKVETKKGWVCKICGYVYEGEDLPSDFICPICKHGAEDFERIE